MLGFDISERTVLRWMRKAPRDPEPAKRWSAFLHNHREAIAAMDFFTVPTLAFDVLYCFFVISHGRRLIFDRGSYFNDEVIETVKCIGIEPKRTSFRSPWQNGVAERWVGTCRRDLLDHVIVVNERHLKRLVHEYIRYYHDDRTHLALAKGTPAGRETESHQGSSRRVMSTPKLGGLQHRYDLAA